MIVAEADHQVAALPRNGGEGEERVRGNGREQVEAEHFLASQRAGQVVDDVAGDRLPKRVAPLAALHRMGDQQLDLERLVPLDPLWRIDQDSDHGALPYSMQAA